LALTPVLGQQKYEDLYLWGRVLFENGNPPGEPVKVEFSRRGRMEKLVYTDADGYFKFKARDRIVSRQENFDKFFDRYHFDLSACELSAFFPKHSSTTITLQRRGIYEKASIGTIYLRPEETDESGLITVNSLAAPKEARSLFDSAKEELSKESPDLPEAISKLEAALEVYPQFAACWNLLGEAHIRSGNLEKACKALHKATEEDQELALPWLTLALLYLKEADLEKALMASGNALAIAPGLGEALLYKASAQLALGYPREAEESLRLALESPDLEAVPRIHFLLGSILSDNGKYAAAAEQYRSYLKLERDSLAAEVAREQLRVWEQAGLLR
jgi:Flp pilus assembly protein TadD